MKLQSLQKRAFYQKETIKLFVLIILYIFRASTSLAQTPNFDDPHFNHLGVKDGLPEGTVNRYLHDSYGYVWICTQNGLVRFDGYQLKKYEFEANDVNSTNIRIIYEDKARNIWIGTISGLYKYDRSQDRVSKYNMIGNGNLKNCVFTFIKQNPRGELWLMYNNNAEQKTCLALLNPNSKQITIYSNKETGYRQLNTTRLFGVCELDNDGNPWIGSDRGILQYFPDRHVFKEHVISNDPEHLNYVMDIRLDTYVPNWLWFRLSLKSTGLSICLGKYNIRENSIKYYRHSDNNSKSIHCDTAMYGLRDSHNQAWFVTFKGLARYDSVTDGFANFEMHEKNPLSSQLWRAIEDHDGNLWCKGDGVTKFNIKTGVFKRYTYNPKKNEDGVLDLPVMNITIDKSGSPWFGVGQSGLQWLDKTKSKFRYYTNEEGVTHFFPGGRVTCFKESSDGNVWIGSEKGLYIWRTRQDTFEHVPFAKPAIPGITIPALTLDDVGNVWFSAYGQDTTITGLYCYNISTRQTKNYRTSIKDSLSFTNTSIRALAADGNGDIWIGTYGAGLCKMNRFTELFTHYPFIKNNNLTMPDHNALDDDQVFSLYLDKQKTIWIGTNNGSLNKYDLTTGKFTSFIDRIPIGVNSITEDTHNNIWVGTYYAGLISFNKKTNAVKTYLEKDGLIYDGAMSVVIDDHNKVWVTSLRGISVLDIPTNKIQTLTTQKGLPSEPSGLGLLTTSKRHVLFGAKEGFVMLDPSKFNPEPTVPQSHIETIQFANVDSPAPLRDSVLRRCNYNKVSLSYNQNRISFNYVGIHHPSRTNIQYAYKLKGYDPDWVMAGEQRSATYTNLSPGTYTFYIKAANSDGVWSKESDSVMIVIAPPWWRTWWAYISYLLIAGGILYAMYKNWLSRIKNKQSMVLHQKEAAQLKALDEMKSRFFSNITHEFRTPLSLIIAPLEQMQNEISEPKVKSQLHTLQNNSEQLLYLINQLLDMSKLEAKSMTSHLMRGDLLLFTWQIVDGFLLKARAAELRLEYDIPFDGVEYNFDPESFRKILQNLLSNAIKFTPAGGSINIKANVESNLLTIDVVDTGIGIPPDKLNKVFNRFFQIDDSRTRLYSGTGIGLSLVKELTELLGGSITASNNSSGHGTTLSLRLPVGNPTSPDIPQLELMRTPAVADPYKTSANQTKSALPDFTKPVLLITEDHPELRAFLLSLFDSDYRVLTASNGKEGWQIAQQEIPDIIISDMMMPEMDGIEFCRLVKTSPATSHIGFIMLTAKTAQASILEGFQNKADEYISKPFHTDELKLRIDNFLDHQRKLQNFYYRQLSVPEEPLQSSTKTDPFLKEIFARIDEHLDNADFTIDQLATSVYMSGRTLVRKLNAIAGISPAELVKQYRLKKAAGFLAEGTSVSEVAWRVGFTSRNYFSTAFKTFYGVAPSEYFKMEIK